MTDNESTTDLLQRVNQGDGGALDLLCGRCLKLAVRVADNQMRNKGAERTTEDEEDVAQSAVMSFWEGVRQGRFPALETRDNLWRILAKITARKVIRRIRRQSCQKRAGTVHSQEDLDRQPSREPPPDLAVEMAEEAHRLLQKLGKEQLRTIALRRMEGHSVSEIAGKLGIALRSVERKLEHIRSTWNEETRNDSA